MKTIVKSKPFFGAPSTTSTLEHSCVVSAGWPVRCGRPNNTANLQYKKAVTHENVAAVEGVDMIEYTNSFYKRFNICHHVSWKTEPKRQTMRLRLDNCQVKSWGDRGCDLAACSWKTWSYSGQMSIQLPASEWLSATGGRVPYSRFYSLGQDPFIPVGSAIFYQKLVDLDNMAQEAMIPSIDTGFSMPVFLLELFDVRSLWRTIRSLLSLRGIGKILRQFGNRPLKEISSKWLEGIFGWLPLVSDIKKIGSIYCNVGEQVREYIAGADSLKTYHYRKAVSPTMWNHPSSFWTSPFTGSITSSGRPYLAPVVTRLDYTGAVTREVRDYDYHATMLFRYTLPVMSAFLKQLLGELDAWGFNLNPAIIWNRIPFSFVVDWFSGIGRWLDSLKKENLEIQVTIYDFARSFNYVLEEKCKLILVDQGTLSYPSDTRGLAPAKPSWIFHPCYDTSSREFVSYLRVPGIPKPPPSVRPYLRLPGGMRWVTAGALLTQFLSK